MALLSPACTSASINNFNWYTPLFYRIYTIIKQSFSLVYTVSRNHFSWYTQLSSNHFTSQTPLSNNHFSWYIKLSIMCKHLTMRGVGSWNVVILYVLPNIYKLVLVFLQFPQENKNTQSSNHYIWYTTVTKNFFYLIYSIIKQSFKLIYTIVKQSFYLIYTFIQQSLYLI